MGTEHFDNVIPKKISKGNTVIRYTRHPSPIDTSIL